MRTIVRTGAMLLVLGAVLAGCTPMTPEEKARVLAEWEARDRQFAIECSQRGGRYVSGSCITGGGP